MYRSAKNPTKGGLKKQSDELILPLNIIQNFLTNQYLRQISQMSPTLGSKGVVK
jgi:hypothetical protein